MAYLGNAPARSFISFERQVFTIVNSQTAYTLSHSVTNENDIRLVINNIVQEPGSGKAYTASGTTLTLSAALTNGTDEMYCVFLGRAVATNAPGAGSVGTSQLAADAITEAKIADDAVESEHLNNNVISGQTELAAEPADTDEFLVSDAGTLKRIDYSLIKGGSLLSAQQWRISSSFSINSSSELTVTGWEKQDQSFAGSVGSDFSVSSGIFTFPTTGVFLIIYQANFGSNDYNDTNTIFKIALSSNSGGAYTNQSQAWLGYETDGNPPSRETATCHALVNVTDASTYRAKFLVHNLDGTNAFLEGDSGYNSTNVVFIKVG